MLSSDSLPDDVYAINLKVSDFFDVMASSKEGVLVFTFSGNFDNVARSLSAGISLGGELDHRVLGGVVSHLLCGSLSGTCTCNIGGSSMLAVISKKGASIALI